MSKEKVFIVLMHKNNIKAGHRTGAADSKQAEWEVEERVEFVNQVRNKHIQSGSAIGNYLERKMVTGARFGMDDYAKFEEYVRSKYPEQMKQLDAVYRAEQVADESPEVFVDSFGNVRTRTVFDVTA